jgi:hypothetical protein
MKAYLVWVDTFDYDTYDGFVVVAQDKDRALAMVKDKFYEFQGEIFVEEVFLNAEHIVIESFNAG